MKTILMLAAIALVTATPAMAQKKAASRPAPGKSEALRVSAISLSEEGFTVLTLKDAAGVKLEPTNVPVTICRRDHLGRLLPGMDVRMVVESKLVAGKRVRFVRPERFRPWCN